MWKVEMARICDIRGYEDNHNEFVFIGQSRELVFVHVLLDKQCAPPTIGRGWHVEGWASLGSRRGTSSFKRGTPLDKRRACVSYVAKHVRCTTSINRSEISRDEFKDRLTRWISRVVIRVTATISVGFPTFSRTWHENKREESYISDIDLSYGVSFFDIRAGISCGFLRYNFWSGLRLVVKLLNLDAHMSSLIESKGARI